MPIIIQALAQAAAAASPEAVVQVAPAQGVIAYPPEFFAAQRPANAREMLDRVPGFSFDGGDNVRGYEGAAGNVLIDGQRPATKTDSLDQLLRRVPFQRVARIELIRGGAPGIDMQGKSIIANVVMKTGDSFHGLVAVAHNYVLDDGRSALAARLEASGQTHGNKWEVGLYTGHGIDDGYGDGPRVRIAADGTLQVRSLIQSQGDGNDYILTGAYELPLLGGSLRVNGRLYRNPYDYDQSDRIGVSTDPDLPAGALVRLHDSDDTDTTEGGLRYSRDFGSRIKLELVGLRQTKDEVFGEVVRSPVFSSEFAQHSETEETRGRGVLKFTQSSTLSWEAGGESALNTLDNHLQSTFNGAPQAIPAANVQVEEKRWEVFGKATWKPSPRWTVEASLRQEGSTISSSGDVTLEKDLSFTKPRIAVAWAFDDKTQIRVRYERVVGQLDFNDFVASTKNLSSGVLTTGNPDLSPEQAWVSEAAIERRFWDAGALTLTYRHSALSDAIDRAPIFTPTGVFDAPANIGDGAKDEMIVGLTLPFAKLGLKGAQLQATSTWRDSEVTDPTTRQKRPLSKLRPQEWEAHFTWDLPQYKLSWGVDAFSAWRETYYSFDQVYIRKLKTYVQPFVEWKPRPDISLRTEFGNFTERGLRQTLYAYGGPRSTNGLAFVEDRDNQFGRMWYVRLRKTFD
jgi:outer membrane receptor protein involved in Fe transport